MCQLYIESATALSDIQTVLLIFFFSAMSNPISYLIQCFVLLVPMHFFAANKSVGGQFHEYSVFLSLLSESVVALSM